MKVGDKVYIKGKFDKGVISVLDLKAGETKEYEIKTEDDIIFRALELDLIEIVKKPVKKEKKKKKSTSKKKA